MIMMGSGGRSVAHSGIHVVLHVWGVFEQLFAYVETLRDLCDIRIFQLEALGGEVFRLVIQIASFRDDCVTSTEAPVQQNLCFTLAILGCHLLDDWFFSEVVTLRSHRAAKSSQWTVGNWLDVEVVEELD